MSITKTKKSAVSRVFTHFPVFSNAHNFSTEGRRKRSDPSFYSEFCALYNGGGEKLVHQSCRALEKRRFGVLEVFLSFFMGKILMQNASNRDFPGLSESLLRSVSKLSIARKRSNIYVGQSFLDPLYVRVFLAEVSWLLAFVFSFFFSYTFIDQRSLVPPLPDRSSIEREITLFETLAFFMAQ
jgi:hypothetical protein